MTQQLIEEQEGWILTEYLPAYASELDPVESLWNYWKHTPADCFTSHRRILLIVA
jgi:hypothetical protein